MTTASTLIDLQTGSSVSAVAPTAQTELDEHGDPIPF